MSEAATLVLFGTLGCHLCDDARARVAPLAAAFGWQLVERDIVEDPELEARYATRIPVLWRTDLDLELAWPFDGVALHRLVTLPKG
jgi:hypothetical protein